MRLDCDVNLTGRLESVIIDTMIRTRAPEASPAPDATTASDGRWETSAIQVRGEF